MTERLYYEDGGRTSFRSRVVRVDPDENDRRRVVLESSAFYPTSGGQLFDTGQLGDGVVVDVVDEGGEVIHIVDGGGALTVGDEIEGRVDQARRQRHRQQHTGQHVLSRVIEDFVGLPTVSSRLGETGNTLDLEIDGLDDDQLDRWEREASAIVNAGRPVRSRMLSAQEARNEGVRDLPDREGPFRIIDIEGFDLNPCGGTHCHNTAEIGPIAITRTEKVRGGWRVHFLCGDRAAEHRRRRDRLVGRLSNLLTTGEDGIESAVQRLQDEAKASSKRTTYLAKQLASKLADDWLATAEPLGDGSGRVVVRVLPLEIAPGAPEALGRLTESPDVVAVLLVPGEGSHQVQIGRGDALTVDCGALLRDVLAEMGGKGGGKPDRARGGFSGEPSVAAARFRDRLLSRDG